jgi:hypothetical protein
METESEEDGERDVAKQLDTWKLNPDLLEPRTGILEA